MTHIDKLAVFVLCASFMGDVLGVSPALAPDQEYAALSSAPTYLYKDKDGQPYALQIEYMPGEPATDQSKGTGSWYHLWKKYLNTGDIASLASRGAEIRYLPDIEVADTDSKGGRQTKALDNCTTTSQVPSDFNIYFNSGTQAVMGNVGLCLTDSRPPGATTQWIAFYLMTYKYFGQGAHAPVIPWFKNTLHGHGIYFGDTSSSPCLNGQDARYHTRMEGWSQWFGHQNEPNTPLWTATGTAFTDTCGATLADTWTPGYPVYTYYLVEIHASIDQWVQYSVKKKVGSTWVTITGPMSRNLTYTTWPTGPGVFDLHATGVFIGSVVDLQHGYPNDWIIGIRSFSTGWF